MIPLLLYIYSVGDAMSGEGQIKSLIELSGAGLY